MSWTEKDFEEKMQHKIDSIYRYVFDKKLVSIKRSKRGNDSDEKTLFMDKELAIDTHLTFENGSVLTAQEKTLRNCNKKFQQFTFEYYNDQSKNELGEWFKLAAQIYFFGYANETETNYSQFWILDVPKLRIGINDLIGIENLTKKYLRKNKPPAKANFFAIPFSEIEKIPGCIISKYP